MASVLTHVNGLGGNTEWPDYVEIVASGYINSKKIHCRLGLDAAGDYPKGTYVIFGRTDEEQLVQRWHINSRPDLYRSAVHLFYFARAFNLEVAVRYECKTGGNHEKMLPFNEVSTKVDKNVVICNGFKNTCTKMAFKYPKLEKKWSQDTDFDVATDVQKFEKDPSVQRAIESTTLDLEKLSTETDSAYLALVGLTHVFAPTCVVVPETIVMMQKVKPLSDYLYSSKVGLSSAETEDLIKWLRSALGQFAAHNVAFADIKADNIGVIVQQDATLKWCLIDVEEVRVYTKLEEGDINACTFPANTNTHLRAGPVAIANTAAAFIATCVQVLLGNHFPWTWGTCKDDQEKEGFEFQKLIGKLMWRDWKTYDMSDPYRKRIHTLATKWNEQFSRVDAKNLDDIVEAAANFYHSGFEDMTSVSRWSWPSLWWR